MLNEREAFKVAFLEKCAQAGLSVDETHTRVKQALRSAEAAQTRTKEGDGATGGNPIPFYDVLSHGAKTTWNKLLEWGPKAFIAASIGVPVVAGAGAGYGLAKMQGASDRDPTEVKMDEKIQAFRRAAARMRLQNQLRERQQGIRSSRPLI